LTHSHYRPFQTGNALVQGHSTPNRLHPAALVTPPNGFFFLSSLSCLLRKYRLRPTPFNLPLTTVDSVSPHPPSLHYLTPVSENQAVAKDLPYTAPLNAARHTPS
jgi:hypothetical protein